MYRPRTATASQTAILPSSASKGIWRTTINMQSMPMLQYHISLGIVLTVILVLGLRLGFDIILYFVSVHEVTAWLRE